MTTIQDVLKSYQQFEKLLKKRKFGYEYEIIAQPYDFVIFQIRFGPIGSNYIETGWVVNANVNTICGGVFDAMQRAYEHGVNYLNEIK